MQIDVTGGNYVFAYGGPLVVCAVWIRPDVDREQGAAFAAEKVGHAKRLASMAMARAFVLDLRRAPESWGPTTHAALGEIVGAWEQVARKVAIFVGQAPIQRIMTRELVRDSAPTHGKVCQSVDEVSAWTAVEARDLLTEVGSIAEGTVG